MTIAHGDSATCSRPRLRGATSCIVHMADDERAVRTAQRISSREWLAAFLDGEEHPACWTWPVPDIIPVFKRRDIGGRVPRRLARVSVRHLRGGSGCYRSPHACRKAPHRPAGRCHHRHLPRYRRPEHRSRRHPGRALTLLPPGCSQLPGQGNKEREIWLHDDAIAYVGQWLEVLGARRGPMFRRIDRWNHIGTQALTPPPVTGPEYRRAP